MGDSSGDGAFDFGSAAGRHLGGAHDCDSGGVDEFSTGLCDWVGRGGSGGSVFRGGESGDGNEGGATLLEIRGHFYGAVRNCVFGVSPRIGGADCSGWTGLGAFSESGGSAGLSLWDVAAVFGNGFGDEDDDARGGGDEAGDALFLFDDDFLSGAGDSGGGELFRAGSDGDLGGDVH